MTSYAQYVVAGPHSLPVRITVAQRRKMFAVFLQTMSPRPGDSILDVGATGAEEYDHSNYLEAWYPDKHSITAVGVDDASYLMRAYPGMRVVRADGVRLPFCDGAFDFVHSSAVLEHVGNGARQAAFLRELWRVARKGIFVTTPNRWYPIDFHTVLPLLHWLPAGLHRRILHAMGHGFFAAEENLNLLSRRGLIERMRQAGIPAAPIATVSLFGWPTNLLLAVRRDR